MFDVHRFANAVKVTVIWIIKFIWWLSCFPLQILIVAKNIIFNGKI